MNDYPPRIKQFTHTPPDVPLAELVDGYCPWKEQGPDGASICMHLEGHDGDHDFQPVQR